MGLVKRTYTDNVTVITAQNLNDIQDNIIAQEASKADLSVLASPFDPTATYAVGDYCIYQGKLYKFTSAHSGAWSGSDVSEVTVDAEIALKADASEVEDIRIGIDGTKYADAGTAVRTQVSNLNTAIGGYIPPFARGTTLANSTQQIC